MRSSREEEGDGKAVGILRRQWSALTGEDGMRPIELTGARRRKMSVGGEDVDMAGVVGRGIALERPTRIEVEVSAFLLFFLFENFFSSPVGEGKGKNLGKPMIIFFQKIL